ncbi:MAG TPA: universal stress protein [Candidatus Bathyarchaeia archaeon]|nr:universal stress protein [Candidatus Bathyarchaeia archaeon]
MASTAELRSILVATDFSANAEAALARGAEIARLHGARLVLCHALVPALLPPPPEIVPLPPEVYEELAARVRERLEKRCSSLRSEGLSAEYELAVGPPAETVLAAAMRAGAGLVVAGTRGLTGWRHLILGSTAARLVRDSHCPVLTVHPGDTARPRRIATVLVPTDFSPEASLAAETAAKLLGPQRDTTRLVLLHVYQVPAELLTHLPPRVVLEAIESAKEKAGREIAQLAKRLGRDGLEIETRLAEGYPPETILEHARQLPADLIAMGTQGLSGLKRLVFGSTAERVLPLASCPVLTVHRTPSS